MVGGPGGPGGGGGPGGPGGVGGGAEPGGGGGPGGPGGIGGGGALNTAVQIPLLFVVVIAKPPLVKLNVSFRVTESTAVT